MQDSNGVPTQCGIIIKDWNTSSTTDGYVQYEVYCMPPE